MKKGEHVMKSTASLMTPQATRLAAFALALTAVIGTPATAQQVEPSNTDLDASIARSAPARPAAKSVAPARTNTARPNPTAARPVAARPSAARPAVANRPTTAHATTAHSTAAHPAAAHPNTAHAASSHPNAGHENRNAVARGSEHAGRPGVRNAAYSHGENLHGGRRIPEERFRGSFGRGHEFHIGSPVMIGGQASFHVGGFWFGLVDPWPAAWLYTDAVYVDVVDGGYVLVNVAHPEVQVAVSAGDAVSSCTVEPAVPVAPVAVAPVVVAPVVVARVPIYTYVTWHYWRQYWR
jgi:hypothetical protein